MFDGIDESKELPTVQFSDRVHSKLLLKALNQMCRIFGDRLPVRFYGHYGTSFDAQVLQHLPDVQNLLLDCLDGIENIKYLNELLKLKKLSFGVHTHTDRDFLKTLPLKNLTSFTLGDNRSKNYDLSYLSHTQKLTDLTICGHTRNIDVIKSISGLKNLRLLSISKKQSLEFISELPNLIELQIMLGGRDSIAEVSSVTLQTLKIIRIKGLLTLGDLSRFPELTYLNVEDQIRLGEINLATKKLQSLKILNCKTLSKLQDLSHLSHLTDLRCYKTNLDYEHMIQSKLPAGLKTLALYTGKLRVDEKLRRTLEELGYKEFD